VSPIYIRPAREQAEHDRLIGFLEAAHDKKYEVLTNKGEARDFALKVGTGTYFPDLILQESKKPVAVIEIETGESTNKLEALAQWVHFGKSKVPFSLYVPVLMYDAARRFCEQHQVAVTEIWTYRPLFDGFDLVRVFHEPQASNKSGKGPAAKVVVMPKVADAPKPQPALEAVEEILARIGSREAAKQASREAARLASKNRASRTQTTPKAPKVAAVAPVAAPPAPAAPVKVAPPAKAAKPTKPTKAAAKAETKVTPKAAKPTTPAKAVKASIKKAPVKKAPAKKAVVKKAVAQKTIVKKPAAKKVAAKKTAVKKKPAAKSKKR